MKDIHDIKEPIELFYNYIPITIIAIILLILLITLLYLSFKKKKNLDIKDEKLSNLKLDPKSFALNELDKIKKDKLIELNRYEAFYTKLTNIIKNYLIQKHNLNTQTNTTQETLEKIDSLKLNQEINIIFEKCLKNYDYAKYSGYKVDESYMNQSFEITKRLFKSI